MPWARGSAKTVTGLAECIRRVHAAGYKYIQLHVANDNNAMIKLALHLGFKVFGVHRSTDGIFYVEMIKEE